jgi:hypothetical protein
MVEQPLKSDGTKPVLIEVRPPYVARKLGISRKLVYRFTLLSR